MKTNPSKTTNLKENQEFYENIERVSGKLHKLLMYFPKYLKIKKNDVILMHEEIDYKAKLQSLPYWLFVIISCGIATIGLIINSPAVIIGAMLISPLMGPILGLGMGIAISDLYLSFKSIINIILSVIVAIITAGFITIIVPLQDITSEILARTSPTVLDLFIALFAGFVAALSSVRVGGKDLMGDVAPGAAIGVALMPPLCVVGYGVGIGFHLSIIWGAFLLFLTNLFGIVMISSLFYYSIYEGYNMEKLIQRLNEKRIQKEILYQKLIHFRLYQYLTTKIFSKKRFLFPLFLIIIISYPLSTSLAFLKMKNDLRNMLEQMILESRDIELIRGVENLIFTNDSVSGTILYSSKGVVDPAWETKIKKTLQEKFSNLKININFIRIAGQADIEKLRQISTKNIIRDEKTENAIRNQYASEIAKRILTYTLSQFPEEAGIVLNVMVSFSPNNMENISIQVAGNRLNKEAEKILKSSLLRGLKISNIHPNQIEIQYITKNPEKLFCITKAKKKIPEILKEIRLKTISFLSVNPQLKIQVYLDEELYEILRLTFPEQFKDRLQYTLFKKSSEQCKVEIQYDYYKNK